MRDYITTIFNLIVGLVDADKIVYLALIGLGLLLAFQLISLIANFHRRFANRCRKISKFLTTNGLSANNYNQFLALVAKMPQEFIRGYKTFEHASYGLPSDYIKRFDSLDVEVNGGILNHGKSLFRALIYGWTITLALLSLALLGGDAALTGFAVADALLVPVLFLILAKIIYFIFNAIKQQQYKSAVDEFNEMLDIMNDKIENNDNLPGPDILAEFLHADLPEDVKTTEPASHDRFDDYAVPQNSVVNTMVDTEDDAPDANATNKDAFAENDTLDANLVAEDAFTEEDESLGANLSGEDIFTETELLEELEPQHNYVQEPEDFAIDEVPVEEQIVNDEFEEQEEAVAPIEQKSEAAEEDAPNIELNITDAPNNEEVQKAVKARKPRKKTVKAEDKGENMEEKRGRGRPKKVAEGELVITNDKQFEEILQRAEKLMRKSEEALSSSQAKRVEKSLKELIDAMQKYKEEH